MGVKIPILYMIYDEVHSFARDYIDVRSFRTQARKAKIREAYKLLTGKKMKVSCSTCYIEALLEIINNTKMATPNYELKKGVLLQAFGDASKTCTNDTLTDELAQFYLTHYPEKAIYFSRIPPVPIAAPAVTIIPPLMKSEPEVEIAETLINSALGEKVILPKVKKPVKAKK